MVCFEIVCAWLKLNLCVLYCQITELVQCVGLGTWRYRFDLIQASSQVPSVTQFLLNVKMLAVRPGGL